jgi:hypothetical protein
MFYLIVYLAAAITAYALGSRPRVAGRVYPVVLLLFYLICAFRFEVGCDWTGYLSQYRHGRASLDYGTLLGGEDPLWWVFVATIRQSGLSYPWLNVIATAVLFTGLHSMAKRQPNRLSFLVFLFPVLFVHLGMSGIRQAAALGILCFAFGAFLDRRLVRFLMLIALASTIHTSAVVFLLLAPLVTGSYTRERLALAGLLAVPGAMLLLGSAGAETAMNRYVETDVDAAGGAFRVGVLSITGLAFFLLLRRSWLQSRMKDYSLASIGSIGMIALALLLPVSSVIADRLGYYFVPIQAMILARIPFLALGPAGRFYAAVSYLALGIVLFGWVSLSSLYDLCYDPYQTWLFGAPESSYRY